MPSVWCRFQSLSFLPSHVSKEPAGAMLLEALELSPLLTCNMSLGEGTGAVAVIPILEMGLSGLPGDDHLKKQRSNNTRC